VQARGVLQPESAGEHGGKLHHSHLAGRGEDQGQEPAQHHGASHSPGQYASCYLGAGSFSSGWTGRGSRTGACSTPWSRPFTRLVSTLAATWVLRNSHLAGGGEDHGQEPAQHHEASHSPGQYASCYLGAGSFSPGWTGRGSRTGACSTPWSKPFVRSVR
jgi:hypothetical protein